MNTLAQVLQLQAAMAQATVQSALDTLATARDEVRVKLHLLSLDARQAWTVLEDKILNVEGRMGDRAEKVTDDVANATRDLADSVSRFVDEHVRTARG